MKKIVLTTKAPAAIGPYSQAIIANGMIYISGQIPMNPEDGSITSEITEATHRVMKNINAVLEEANTNFSNVVKASIFLKTMDDFIAMNQVYESYFEKGNYPARECVAVKTLPKNVNVEISIIALVSED